MGDGRVDGLVDAAADGRRIAAGGDVAQAFAEDRPGQHRGRRGAVAGDVRGLRGHLVDQLGAHVLEAVFQLDFLAHGHAVLGDGRAAERLVEDHVAAGRAQASRRPRRPVFPRRGASARGHDVRIEVV